MIKAALRRLFLCLINAMVTKYLVVQQANWPFGDAKFAEHVSELH